MDKKLFEIIDLAISRHNKPIEIELKHIHKALIDINNKVEKQNGRVDKCEEKMDLMKIDLLSHKLKSPENGRIEALEDSRKAEVAVKKYVTGAIITTSTVVAILVTIATTILSYVLYLGQN